MRRAYGDEIYDRLARLKRAVRPGEPVQPQPEREARAMSRVLILSWDGGGNTPSAFNLGAGSSGAGTGCG